LIIGVTIPVSIVATFAPMHLFGVSLNIISLGGLALGVGMLVAPQSDTIRSFSHAPSFLHTAVEPRSTDYRPA
jgi:hypothetical protein